MGHSPLFTRGTECVRHGVFMAEKAQGNFRNLVRGEHGAMCQNPAGRRKHAVDVRSAGHPAGFQKTSAATCLNVSKTREIWFLCARTGVGGPRGWEKLHRPTPLERNDASVRRPNYWLVCQKPDKSGPTHRIPADGSFAQGGSIRHVEEMWEFRTTVGRPSGPEQHQEGFPKGDWTKGIGQVEFWGGQCLHSE